MSAVDRLRRWLALRLQPAIDVAREKRRLESLARESGASQSVAKRIVSEYFRHPRNQ